MRILVIGGNGPISTAIVLNQQRREGSARASHRRWKRGLREHPVVLQPAL